MAGQHVGVEAVIQPELVLDAEANQDLQAIGRTDGSSGQYQSSRWRRFLPRSIWLVARLAALSAAIVVALAHWDGGAALFLGLLIASCTGLLDGRVSVAIGLLSLAACPLLLIAERYAWLQQSTIVNYYASNLGLYSLTNSADEVAVWAYYFLCIGVAALIMRAVVSSIVARVRNGWPLRQRQADRV